MRTLPLPVCLAITLSISIPAQNTSDFSKLNNIRYVDGVKFTTIQAAHDDLTSSGGLIIVPFALTATGVTTISKSNVTVQCTPLGTITKSANSSNSFTITGSNVNIRDCTILASTSTGGDVVSAQSVTNIRVLSNVITNAYNSAVSFHVTTGGAIEGSKITQSGNNALNGIFVRNGSTRIRVANNEVMVSTGTSSQADGISVIAGSAQAGPKEVTITGNVVRQGTTDNFCIEVGNFSGTSNPTNIVTSGNSCLITGTAGGGISYAAVTGGTISGNTVDANGQTISIAGIEIGVSLNVAVTGNRVLGSTGTRRGITVDQSSGSTVTGNTIKGFGTAANDSAIYMGSSSATAARRNVVLGNTTEFDTSTTNARVGIWIQSNHASADVSDNLVSSNIIIGPGGGTSYGIVVQHDSGTLARTTLAFNRIRSVNTDINRTGSQTGTTIFGNVAATYGGSGGTGETIFDFDTVNGQIASFSLLRPNTTGVDFGTTGTRWDAFLSDTSVKRIKADGGTALASGDFTGIHTNWGSGATVGSVVGTDQGFEVTVTSGSSGTGANPTLTLTFKDGTWTSSPVASCGWKAGGTGTLQHLSWTAAASTLVITYNGTPGTGQTFPISCVLMGR